MLLVCLFAFALDVDMPALAKTMSAIPEDADNFLSLPLDLTVDDRGRVFVADANAKTVFVWNKDGSFAGNFGKEGAGPGEFSFWQFGPQAYLGTSGDRIYVFDGGRRTINIFDADFNFISSTSYQMKGGRGRANYFKVASEDMFVINARSFGRDTPPKQLVGLYDMDGEMVHGITEVDDKTFEMQGNGSGRPTGMTINAFSPQMVVHYDDRTKRVIVADSGRPSFDIYALDGKPIMTVNLEIPHLDVTDEDIAEYKEIRWIKNSSFVKPAFPDKKAYFTHILPLADGTFLVFEQSPFYRNVTGVRVDERGKVQQKLSYSCGEDGSLYGANGRVFAVATDDEGEFMVHELALN